MKQFLFGKGLHSTLTLVAAALLLALSSCKKDDNDESKKDAIDRSAANLSEQTRAELRAAKTASVRYMKLDSAIADGYADINVVRQNMGFHYLKAALLDTVFNPAKPEILVYNKDHNGNPVLVAVEYAVPLALRPNAAPEGFTGAADVWTYSTEFNLWLLHAWVWEYNPWGIFSPNNPNVHLH